ncbi:MAG: L-ectoine synthase [Planctomycetota bacterium]|jgi:L-ectoine synthase
MFVTTLDNLKEEGNQEILCDGNLRCIDFLFKNDGMGFTLSDVRSTAGLDEELWYKHHWEANYIIAGKGLLEDLSTGQTWPIEPGVVYAVGPEHRHRFQADTDIHNISIFSPPLKVDSTFDEDGSPEPSGDVLTGPGALTVKRLDELRAKGREKAIAGGSARSIRALLQEDQLGFTLCDVRMDAGYQAELWYKYHWEANIILVGHGKVSDLNTDESWPLKSGTIYIVGPNDRHCIEAASDLHLISIFNPPLQGDEQHDDEGTLPPSGPLPPGLGK